VINAMKGSEQEHKQVLEMQETKAIRTKHSNKCNWKVAPRGRETTPYTRCWWSTRVQVRLSKEHTTDEVSSSYPLPHVCRL